MNWITLSTMAFAVICVYGGLILTLSHVLFRRPSEEEDENPADLNR